VRNAPGRKTDTNVAGRPVVARACHGELRATDADPAAAGSHAARRQLVREISQHTQRIQRVLEDANVKLASMVSNALGFSGW
jgi:hypothetical protein